MRKAYKLLMLSALSVQAACSNTPPPITYVPPPDPSFYASLSCEELAHARDGAQRRLQSIDLDRPNDQVARLVAQSYVEGASNAIRQKGCSGVSPQPVAAQSTAQNSFCSGVYSSLDVLNAEQGGTGVITTVWEDKAISARPAAAALGPFQAFMASKGQSASFLPAYCDPFPDAQMCTAHSQVGEFTRTTHHAIVSCFVSQSSAEKSRQLFRTRNPRLTQIEWRPANAKLASLPANQPLNTNIAPVPAAPQPTNSAVSTQSPAQVQAPQPASVQIAQKAEVVVPTASTTNEYCYFHFSSDDFRVTPNVFSPIFRDAQVSKTAANQIAAIKQYQHKVNQTQSGTWRESDFNLIPCNPTLGVCMGYAQSLFKPKQLAALVCFTSESAAQAKLDYDRRLDPQGITIDR